MASIFGLEEHERLQAALVVELEEPKSAAAVIAAINNLAAALSADLEQRVKLTAALEKNAAASHENTQAQQELTRIIEFWTQMSEPRERSPFEN